MYYWQVKLHISFKVYKTMYWCVHIRKSLPSHNDGEGLTILQTCPTPACFTHYQLRLHRLLLLTTITLCTLNLQNLFLLLIAYPFRISLELLGSHVLLSLISALGGFHMWGGSCRIRLHICLTSVLSIHPGYTNGRMSFTLYKSHIFFLHLFIGSYAVCSAQYWFLKPIYMKCLSIYCIFVSLMLLLSAYRFFTASWLLPSHPSIHPPDFHYTGHMVIFHFYFWNTSWTISE